jgi:hypothetical protein
VLVGQYVNDHQATCNPEHAGINLQENKKTTMCEWAEFEKEAHEIVWL